MTAADINSPSSQVDWDVSVGVVEIGSRGRVTSIALCGSSSVFFL